MVSRRAAAPGVIPDGGPGNAPLERNQLIGSSPSNEMRLLVWGGHEGHGLDWREAFDRAPFEQRPLVARRNLRHPIRALTVFFGGQWSLVGSFRTPTTSGRRDRVPEGQRYCSGEPLLIPFG